MKLLNGVTGFYDYTLYEPPQVNYNQFKQLCYSYTFTNQNKARVIDSNVDAGLTNFYLAHLEHEGVPIYILLNMHHPYLAFASRVDVEHIHFVNHTAMYEFFCAYYHVLPTSELNRPVNKKLLSDSKLNKAEMEQITYWQPKTVGEIIFNYWD
ncbi:hypothetical protein FLK61_31405 [Paenalkalicoccus suaedae]|uniref:Uncharacterized protein n=1 Tax=Paenalkalicoccus suaedae TaxID=2592382 RepID=A0A859FEB9_9BACI|nr:hypothetical protein [Paenalkalicoccus suaedae]QKS71220.1 hypothetical protein FLK61_31405 [Paenalkalicoccus suaedae]